MRGDVMANYNSKRFYNRKLPDGGANYNSGPFAIIVLDNGSGLDDVYEIISNVDVQDTAITNENILLVANIEVLDNSISSDDSISLANNINVADNAFGQEFLSVIANLDISDIGIGNDDNVGIIGAFFVIDSNNILHPLGVIVTGDSRFDLIPATRDSAEEIPGRHGEYDFGTELKTRLLELDIASDEGLSPLEKSHLQRLLSMYLDPTKGYKTLIFSDDIEKTYKVKYSGKIDLTEHATWLKAVLPFKTDDSYIESSFDSMLNGSGTLTNNGTAETGLIIEISGPATNPSLTIGGEVLKYTGTIGSGQKLTIDTDLETAKVGNANAMAGYNEAFPLLYPGSVNVVAGNNVSIRAKDKWI